MVVLTIVAILMTAGMMSYVIAMDKARAASCEMTLDAFKKGMETYFTDHSRYPPDDNINTITDMRQALHEYLGLSGTPHSCQENIEYTCPGNEYRLEAEVLFAGGAGNFGVKYILENSELKKQPL